MGRLNHLKLTLPTFPTPCVVVDYSCPDSCHLWASEQPGVTVVRVEGEEFFHKSRALNLGAAKAFELGADRLVFLDADTQVWPGFQDELANLTQGTFMIADGSVGQETLVGVLAAHRDDFLRSGGYDEAYRGWGVEDLDMRLRLHLVAGCSFKRFSDGMLSSIPHNNSLRTKNYTIKNHWISRAINARILERNICTWTGNGPSHLGETAKALLRVWSE